MTKFKRFLTLTSALCLLTPLTSCSSFFSTNEGTSIKEILTEKLDNGDVKVTIKYTNDSDLEDQSFIVPRGEKGTSIGNVESKISQDGTKVILTFRYTDSNMSPTVVEVPIVNGIDGVSIAKVESVFDPDTLETQIVITYTDSTKEHPHIDTITVPRGEKGNGIKSIEPSIDEEGNATIVIKYTDDKMEPVTITLPKGEKGTSIIGVRTEDKDDETIIHFIFDDGTESKEVVRIRKNNTWISGTIDPKENEGRNGDFYINTETLELYQKVDGTWNYIARLKKEDAKFDVRFNLNVEDDSAKLIGKDLFKIQNGQTFYSERTRNSSISIPKATREGYDFLGWYTGTDESDYSIGRFTDLTPVVSNMTLYAWWKPASK